MKMRIVYLLLFIAFNFLFVSAKAYSHDDFLKTFSANSQKHKCMLRDSVSPNEQKFKRWELGVNGGANLQKYKYMNDLVDANTIHTDLSISYYLEELFAFNVLVGYDKFGYAYKDGSSFIYCNTLLYSMNMNHVLLKTKKFTCTNIIGFKTNYILQYHTYGSRRTYNQHMRWSPPNDHLFRFGLHTCFGLKMGYQISKNLSLNLTSSNQIQLIDFMDYFEYPLAGYKQWASVLTTNYWSITGGISYHF
jgi:hypothetical protein